MQAHAPDCLHARIRVALLLQTLVLLFLTACTAAQIRGLDHGSYVSTSRPDVRISARDLQAQGSWHGLVKLQDMGVLGGLNLDTWLTTFGSSSGPMAVVGHVELPMGWNWDANMSQPFAQDESWLDLGGIPFLAQTTLEEDLRNPFVESEVRENDAPPVFWLVRTFSARFNGNRTKLILQYRERAPQGITTLARLPYGQGDLVKAFGRRADTVFLLSRDPGRMAVTDGSITLRTRFLDRHFFGSASPVYTWPAY